VKKILLLALAVGAGVFAKKKMDDASKEQALWHEATDPVHRT
jgi:hypothetical protein